MDIERIEDWRGQQVVDEDGEKIGKLEDVYRPTGGGDPEFASVKTGLMGRHLTLVPLRGATVTRDHIRLAIGKALVDDAPHASGEDELTATDEDTLLAHYGLPDPDGRSDAAPGDTRYESAAIVESRAAESDSKLKEAEKLEAQAADEDHRARQAREAAQAGAETERDAASQREAALQEAARLREEADGTPGGSEPPPPSPPPR
jgi:hypothetical protein